MTSNPEPMVQQVPGEFQHLLADVTGPEARVQTASTVELTLFRRRLALGAVLWRLFVVTRAAMRPAEPVLAPDGTPLTYHDQRPTTYYSVFGQVRFARHSFMAPGQEGHGPLDAEGSLPAHGYADLRREWAVYGTTDESSRESQTVLARILGLSLRVQALETSCAKAGEEVATFYEQPAAPPPASTVATILVLQPEGKGVPMVQPPRQTPPRRLGKGQKRTKKQEAIVTGLYTSAPYPRTPQEVVAALWQDPDRPERAPRPAPVGTERRATLEGKAVARGHRAQRVAQREGPHLEPRVALSHGAEALQEPWRVHVPEHTFVLDLIHTTESLWDTAKALLGETHPQRTAWVRAYLEPLRAGQTDAVIMALEAEGHEPTGTGPQRQAVQRTVGDDRRNRPSMHDDEYLARGWPMGTGVVEGACGPLVNDRLEQAGRRWTPGGAQVVLDLRAVRLKGHWDAYGPFHRQQQHQRFYGTSAPTPALAEAQALAGAA